jgi:tetratricopeptide (TPR) repeat protein
LRLGGLALEIGSELWAHGDSTTASVWFTRAFASFATPRDSSQAQETRWGEARAAARLGRLREALALATALASHDSSRLDYSGLAGVLYAELGDRGHASGILERLAQGNEPFTWGGPQFEAARIAAVLGDVDRATNLLARAYDKGYPYGFEFHRDPYLARVRGTAIARQMEAHTE